MNNIVFDKNKKILVQSMTNTKTKNVDATIKQIIALEHAGCDLVRVAIFDDNDAEAIREIVKLSPLPIIADIHFNYLYAIKAIEAGVFKIRLNPGNIDDQSQIKQIIDSAKKYGTYIRIGVNCGSLPNDIVKEHGISAQSMLLSLSRYLKIFEENDFDKIVISLKSSDPLLNLEVNRLASKQFKYPIHIGVTESGTLINATIKSTIGLAPLISEGIGDTIRVSISDDPIKEVEVCIKMLNFLNKRKDRVEIISCPTCGRLDYNMFSVVDEIERYCYDKHFNLKISILGCIVNGIGEAKHADIGIAGSKASGILFENGKIIKNVNENELVDELKKLIDKKYNEFLLKNQK